MLQIDAHDTDALNNYALLLQNVQRNYPEAKALLLRALDVFMEDVVTKVHDSAPLRPKFIDVLKGMRDSFAEFLRKSEDYEVTEKILGLVSNSVGLEGVETEQCREQEQEKEQEQEQEQEIEMERYVDMAYQRDGEEMKDRKSVV